MASRAQGALARAKGPSAKTPGLAPSPHPSCPPLASPRPSSSFQKGLTGCSRSWTLTAHADPQGTRRGV